MLFALLINNEKDETIKTALYAPDTGLFGGLDHTVPELTKEIKENLQEWRKRRVKREQELLTMRLYLGEQCNFQCAYCLQDASLKNVPLPHSASRQRTAKELADGLIWMLGQSGRKNLELNFMGGEPLLHWEFITKIVPLIRHSVPEASFTIITNGILFDGEKARYCLDNNFSVTLSHDGPGQKNRGKDPLAPRTESYSALRWFCREAPERFSVNPVLTRDNYDVEEIWGYLENRLHSKLFISEALPVNPATQEIAERFALTDEDLPKLQKRIYDLLSTRHMDWFLTYQDMFFQFALTFSHISVPMRGQCHAFGRYPYVVDRSGWLRRCTSMEWTRSFDDGCGNGCGNLFDLKKQNASWEKICAPMQSKPLSWTGRERCYYCPWIAACMGGCPILPNELHSIHCAQRGALAAGIFTILLKTIYPEMGSFEITPIMELRVPVKEEIASEQS